MNFSGYFLLAASAVLIVSAQQSSDFSLVQRERDTIRVIEQSSKLNLDITNSYKNGTKLLTKGALIILDGISAAEKRISQNPEDAKKLVEQAFEKGRIVLFESGIPILMTIGRAFGLSNDAARPGFDAAIQFILRSGIAALDAINNAEILFKRGSDVGENAVVLLFEAGRSAVETGFVASYNNIQRSIQKVDEGLKLAQSKQNRPMIRRAQYENYCEAGDKDSQGSNAIKVLNEGAKNALNRGANYNQVQNLRQILKCLFGDFWIITDEIERSVENIKIMESFDDAENKFSKASKAFKDGIYELVARIILELGLVEVKSSNQQQNNDMDEAIVAIEKALGKILLANEIARELIVIGRRNGGDVPLVANQATVKLGNYGKTAFIEGIVKIGEIGFNML